MKFQLIRNREDLAGLEGGWNELLSDSGADTIFLTWEWISSWVDVRERPLDLFVVVARDDSGRLMALAPFYRVRYRLFDVIPVSVLRVLGDSSSGAEYGNVILRNGRSEELADRLGLEFSRRRDSWDLIWIPRFAKWRSASSDTYRVFDQPGLSIRERPSVFSSVPLPSDSEEYLRRASANRRQQILRTSRKVLASKSRRVRLLSDRSRLPQYLDALFELHEKRWRARSDPGAFRKHPLLAPFYRNFAPKAFENGWLFALALEEEGDPVAMQYGYLYKGSYMQMQEGFDPTVDKGLGTALRKSAIDLLISDSVSEYDFLGGFTEHKRRWQAIQRTGCDLMIAHQRLLSRIIFRSGIWPTGRYLTTDSE